MAKGPEARLQRRIRKAILTEYPLARLYKIHGNAFQNAGIPDIVGCIPAVGKNPEPVLGLFFGLEVKVPGKTPSPIQEFEISRILRAGGAAGVITSPEAALTFISSWLKRMRVRACKDLTHRQILDQDKANRPPRRNQRET